MQKLWKVFGVRQDFTPIFLSFVSSVESPVRTSEKIRKATVCWLNWSGKHTATDGIWNWYFQPKHRMQLRCNFGLSINFFNENPQKMELDSIRVFFLTLFQVTPLSRILNFYSYFFRIFNSKGTIETTLHY